MKRKGSLTAKMCALGGHGGSKLNPNPRQAVVVDGAVVIVCTRCGETVKP